MLGTWRRPAARGPLLVLRRCIQSPAVVRLAADPRKEAADRASDKEVRQRAHIQEALSLVRAYANRTHDETVGIDIYMNIDAKRSDERLRGTVMLPHGTGKKVRVAVFTRGENVDVALAAGADLVGAEDLVAQVVAGDIDFDKCIATADAMAALAKAARILGPKGLMPSPKRGTVVTDVAEAIQNAKAGEVDFRAQRDGVVNAGFGKVSFGLPKLTDNCLTLMTGMLAARPVRFHGKPAKRIVLSSTAGPAVRLDSRLF